MLRRWTGTRRGEPAGSWCCGWWCLHGGFPSVGRTWVRDLSSRRSPGAGEGYTGLDQDPGHHAIAPLCPDVPGWSTGSAGKSCLPMYQLTSAPTQGDEELHGEGAERGSRPHGRRTARGRRGSRETREPGARSSTGTPRWSSACVLRYRLSSAELQDVAQTVWLRLIEHLGSLREPRALPKWLITTAKREALRSATASTPHAADRPAGRGLGRRAWSPRTTRTRTWCAPSGTPPSWRGSPSLSPRQRQLLLMLSEDPPVPYAEISRRTGIPVGAIGPTRARALERLRRTPAVQQLVTTVGAEPSERQGS